MDINASSSTSVSPVTPTKARKRIKQQLTWKRNVAKRLKYSAKELPEFPRCGHKTKAFMCATLKMNDLLEFHKQFYKNDTKISQDNFILKFMILTPVKRRRPGNGARGEKRAVQTKFVIRSLDRRFVPVCQKAFLKVLHITRARVSYIAKQFAITGNNASERRGGNRKEKLFRDKKEAVIKFICSLQCVESHYCRGKSVRKYLSSDLSANKLFKMYNAQATAENKVKRSFFRNVFVLNFNLGFGGARTDMCSTCLELRERISREKDVNEKQTLITTKRVHTLRANAFFCMVKDPDPNILILSFDMEKNLPLPKVQDQQAYYSRQLYLHNFTVVQGSSKSKLTTANCFSYCWTEDKYGKGSNQVASALFHRLQNTDLSSYTKIRLVSDGCGGQNKNRIVLAMTCRWFLGAPKNIESLELIFPVRGHSFIPPDRVFGVLEKEFKKREVIANPNEYYDIIKKHATLLLPDDDFQFYDWRKEAETVLKPPGSWHFKLAESKRIHLKRNRTTQNQILVSGEQFYKSESGVFRSLTRKNLTISNINPEIIDPDNINNVKREKLKDVQKLLEGHYGQEWRQNPSLGFYHEVLAFATNPTVPREEEELCEPGQEEEVPLRV